MSGFISYETKNGIEYAKICFSHREGKKVRKTYINLGRVIDKEHLIFRNRKQGIFRYNPEDGSFLEPDPSLLLDAMKIQTKKEKMILDFGDVYFLQEFITKEGLMPSLQALGCKNNDTLLSLLDYYILCPMENCYASDWWEGSYARILYPKADLTEQGINVFLTEAGDEKCMHRFFEEYIKHTSSETDISDCILTEITGMSDSIHFPVSTVKRSDGQLFNKGSLFYVFEPETGLPVLFYYEPDFFTDVSTLEHVIEELRKTGVNVRHAVLDPDCCTEINILDMVWKKIPFLMRYEDDPEFYEPVAEACIPWLCSEENLTEHEGIYLYMKHVNTELASDRRGYVYFIGFAGLKDETPHADKTSVRKEINPKDVYILLSCNKIPEDTLLPLFFAKLQTEQIFSIRKNSEFPLPVKIQNEDTLRGHLLLTFTARAVTERIRQKLKKTGFDEQSLFISLRGQNCKVYDDHITINKAGRKADDFYKLFNITCPEEIRADNHSTDPS